jgi:hypothetical protein
MGQPDFLRSVRKYQESSVGTPDVDAGIRKWEDSAICARLARISCANRHRQRHAKRYVKRLLENAKIKHFLTQRYADLLEEFQELAALESL